MSGRLDPYRNWLIVALCGTALGASCARTKPGTHVEIVNRDGANTYVAGAAAPGVGQTKACRTAVRRSVAAIALRFAQENDDLGEAVAESVGATNGEVFLQRFAKQRALDGAVQDVDYDPSEHLCMASVRWTPPTFLQDAVRQFAEQMREQELGDTDADASQSPGASSSPSAAATPSTESTPPPAAESVAPPAAQAATPAAQCTDARGELRAALQKSRSALDDYQGCLDKSNETACHRYKLYLDEAKQGEQEAANALVRCVNQSLSTALLQVVEAQLPGHAAIPVETAAAGARIIWTYDPLAGEAYALRIGSGGNVEGKTPLAANQVTWLRERLGL